MILFYRIESKLAVGFAKKNVFVFLGPPGSGKGSMCQRITNINRRVAHVSIGTLCRKYSNENTELGKLIKNLIEKGNLIPFENISLIVHDCLEQFCFDDNFDVLLLDGFPRNDQQAMLLVELNKLFSNKLNFYFVLFDAEREILKERMSLRVVCSNNACEKIYSQKNYDISIPCYDCASSLLQRKDDMLEVIEKRLDYYVLQKDLIFDIFKRYSFEISIFDANKSFDVLIFEVEDFFKFKNIDIVLKK